MRLREGSLVRRIIVGVTGASGSIYAYSALRALRAVKDIEINLILSQQAKVTIPLETDKTPADFEALAHVVHREDNLAASISSGSYITDGMLVIPCSIKSASAIAHSLNDNLLTRARRLLEGTPSSRPGRARDAPSCRPFADAYPARRDRCGHPPADPRDVREAADHRRHRRPYRRESARSVSDRASPLSPLGGALGPLPPSARPLFERDARPRRRRLRGRR